MNKSNNICFQNSKKQILSNEANVAVIGLGVVGLNLAMNVLKKDYDVFGHDINSKLVSKIQSGISPFSFIPDKRIKQHINNNDAQFIVDTKPDGLEKCDAFLICVPTPAKADGEPNLEYVVSSIKTISKYIRPGCLVILESSTYPGTTVEILQPELEKTGLKVGQDIYLAYSPERVNPSSAMKDLDTIPKVVGADDKNSLDIAVALYEKIFHHVVPVSSSAAAEATKLLENTFRLVNLVMINELQQVWGQQGIDIWEVIHAASSKPFGFHAFYPGPGIGGHCIPVDPKYLTWKASQMGENPKLIKQAVEMITLLPQQTCMRIVEEINNVGKHIHKVKILLLGVAYKADIDDVRESPANMVFDLLTEDGAEVDYHDPYIEHWEYTGLTSVGLTNDTLKTYDCLVVITDHTNMNYHLISQQQSSLIIDTRNIMRRLGYLHDNLITL